MKSKYELNKNSFLASSFQVFTPFSYKGRRINPKKTLDKFFETGDDLYRMLVEGMSNSAGRDFRETLAEEISLAEDIALWTTYLSKRGGIVGSRVREQLSQVGITNPNYLANDVKVLGENILRLYGSR